MEINIGSFHWKLDIIHAFHSRRMLKIQFDHEYRMRKLETNNAGTNYHQCTFGTPIIVPMPSTPENKFPSPQRAAEYLVTTLGFNEEIAMRIVETLSQFYSDKSKQ